MTVIAHSPPPAGGRSLAPDTLVRRVNRLGATVDDMLSDSVSDSDPIVRAQFRQITDGQPPERKKLASTMITVSCCVSLTENPMEPINLGRLFKRWQEKNGVMEDKLCKLYSPRHVMHRAADFFGVSRFHWLVRK